MAHEPHQMVLSETHTNGEEEWLCPTCGRRLIIAVSPSMTHPGIAIYVMIEGETEVAHTFAHENAQADQLEAAQPGQEVDLTMERVKPLTQEEQERLAPFIAWLETVDLGI